MKNHFLAQYAKITSINESNCLVTTNLEGRLKILNGKQRKRAPISQSHSTKTAEKEGKREEFSSCLPQFQLLLWRLPEAVPWGQTSIVFSSAVTIRVIVCMTL